MIQELLDLAHHQEEILWLSRGGLGFFPSVLMVWKAGQVSKVGSAIVSIDQGAIHLLVVIDVHGAYGRVAQVHELAEMQQGAVCQMEITTDESKH